MGQGEILEALYYCERLNSSELADYTGVCSQAVTKSLKWLISHNYVDREVVSNKIYYVLTIRGKEFTERFYL